MDSDTEQRIDALRESEDMQLAGLRFQLRVRADRPWVRAEARRLVHAVRRTRAEITRLRGRLARGYDVFGLDPSGRP